MTSTYGVLAGFLAAAFWSATSLVGQHPHTGSGGLLPADRWVEFRTFEGTWISLDISPDGTTIALDLLGDLYEMPVTGGGLKRVTAGISFDRQPRYSPDGRHIAYVSDRGGSDNIWLVDRRDLKARQISALRGYVYNAVSSPDWTPNGRTLVVAQALGATRSGGVPGFLERCWLLAAYEVATGEMRWISDTSASGVRGVLGPVVVQSGDEAFASVGPPCASSGSDAASWRLARLRLKDGRVEPEMSSRAGRGGMRPAVSPSGRYLSYVTSSGSRYGLRLRDLLTNRERWLLQEALERPPFAPGLDTRDLAPGYAFTPDSRAIIIAFQGGIHRVDVSSGVVAAIPFVADVRLGARRNAVHRQERPDRETLTRSVSHPALSPDGYRVAFTALDRLWVMQLPRGNAPRGIPRRLTTDTVGEFYPSWSPDGRWVYYSTWLDGEGGAVRRIAVPESDDGRLRHSEILTSDSALYFHTAVSPRGDGLVSVRSPAPPNRLLTGRDSLELELIWLAPGARNGRKVTSLRSEQHPWYGPRYPVDQVYFTEDPGRVFIGLSSWRMDGTDKRAIALRGLAEAPALYRGIPGTGVVAPDGIRALVARKYTLFEAVLSKAKGVPVREIQLPQAESSPPAAPGSARRVGTAPAPWISWSADGRRGLFGLGGVLFVGDTRPGDWTSFEEVDVPLPISPDVPAGNILLVGARIVTMRGSEVIPRGDILIRGNRIAAVGVTGSLSVPTDMRVIQVRGMTILPGFVDLHDHMFLPKGVHPQQSWQNFVRLAHGVTTTRDPQPNYATDVFAYREREKSGDLIGPRLYSTGPAYLGTDPPIRSRQDAREAVRPNTVYSASETFKVYYDPAVGRDAWQFLATAVDAQRMNATTHVHTLQLAVTAILDGYPGIEHVPDIQLYDDVSTLIAARGVTLTPTFNATIWGGWHFSIHQYGDPRHASLMRRFMSPPTLSQVCHVCTTDPAFGAAEATEVVSVVRNAAQIVSRGGRVAVGSHGEIPGLGFHYEMWLYALGGMPAHSILKSATIVGAEALGHARDFGSIETGKLADLQILDKNPLEDIKNTTSIRYVMKNGRLYEADDLTEIWPRHKPLPSIYLWEPKNSSDSVAAPGRGR